MPKHRPRALIDGILFGLVVLCLLLGVWALVFFQDNSRENRALFIIVSSVGLLAGFSGLIFVRLSWKWLIKRNCKKVLSAWQKSLQSKDIPIVDVAHHLSEGTLRVLAMQLFARIGYSILNKEEDEGYVRMRNPDGHLELVACKQLTSQVDIQALYEFHMDLKRDGAVQGYFWAAGGFTPDAIYWIGKRPIILADRHGIGNLIDCVLAHHSRFLE